MNSMTPVWPGVMAHRSGGLWIEATATLLLADLHLGYSFAQRRRGQLGPLADHETARRLTTVLDELRPSTLVLLGDIVHAPDPGPDEAPWIATTLQSLAARCELICVRGNHDRKFLSDFAGLKIPLIEEWRLKDLHAVHGDRLPQSLPASDRLAIGHLHPAVAIEDAAGTKRRLPVFLVAGPLIVLPAFSPFATGLDVWRKFPDEIAQLAAVSDPEAIAATGNRVVRLGSFRDLINPAAGSRPENFRGGYRQSK